VINSTDRFLTILHSFVMVVACSP